MQNLADKLSEFDRLAGRFLEDYWQLNPVEATHAGQHAWDDRLPDWSESGQAARREWRENYRAAFEAIGDDDLDSDRRLDKKVALAEIAGQEVEEEWRWAGRAPAFYIEQAMQGLNDLLARPAQAIPPAERERHLLARLEATAGVLEQGRRNLKPELGAPEFREIGLVAARGALDFVKTLPLPGDQAQSEAIRGKTLAALEEYRRFLEQDLQPEGHFALGKELYERLLRQKHGLDLSAAELYEVGRETAARMQARLEEVAQKIDPDRTWQAIIEDLKADHPTRETLLKAYSDEAARARAFVVERGLATIPAGEQFAVRPTAPFLQATMPLGHFEMTPPFDPGDNLGVLYITPVSPDLPEQRQAELLSAHCYTAVRAICLHETYPGHHLQLWCAKLYGSPLRRQFASTLFVEGWALYCEELMEEAGFFDTPALSLWQLKNSMWRAVRIMIDVGLHSGQLSLEAATQLLVEQAGLEPNTARGEALRYTTSPTQPSSYMLGRNRIVEIRRRTEQSAGPDFNLKAFHDRLMRYSSVTPAFIPDNLAGE